MTMYSPPGKEERCCPHWWFSAWNRLVNSTLSIVGEPVLLSKPGCFYIDTHVHTLFSRCSITQPMDLLLRAARIGLSGIAVLDHNNPQGARDTAACAEYLKENDLLPQNFLVIPGQEINTNKGHLGALFTLETYPIDLSPVDLTERVHQDGGLVVAVHPFHSTGIGEALFDVPLDLLEVDCGAIYDKSLSAKARSLMSDERLRNVGAIGSSDAHYVNAVGMCYTTVTGNDITLEGVKEAMLTGRTESQHSHMHGKVERMLGKIAKLR